MSRSSNHFSNFSKAFYDAVRQGQRINDSFHDEMTKTINKQVAGQATCNNISLSLPRRRTQFNGRRYTLPGFV